MTTVNAFLAANIAEEAGIRNARRNRMTGPVANWLTTHGFSPARFTDLVSARMPDDTERIMARMSEGARFWCTPGSPAPVTGPSCS